MGLNFSTLVEGFKFLFQSPSAIYQQARNSSRHRHPLEIDRGDADYSVQIAGDTLTQKARWLDANSDHVTGAFDYIVASIVGAGVITEPLIRLNDDTPYTEINQQIKDLWLIFQQKPDMSGNTGQELQRQACRSWLRDGEVFVRFYEGVGYPHNTQIPLSIQLLESDQLDFHHNGTNIVQGVEKDEYDRPIAYYFHKKHPGRLRSENNDLIRIPASEICHLKLAKRLGQTRGVSCLHAVIDRVQDLGEIDVYETAAVKMGASIGLVIKRNGDFLSDGIEPDRARITRFYPGMVLDDLSVGEEPEMLTPNGRPNPELIAFRDDTLRGIAAGMGISASTLMRKYEGSYSSERQALVEAQRLMDVRIEQFISQFIQPIYTRFIQTVVLYQLIDIKLKKIKPNSLYRASHKSPTMPWIDPLKEVNAKVNIIQAGLDSRANQIRASGRNPDDVMQEIIAETQRDMENGLSFTTSADGNPAGVNDMPTQKPQEEAAQ